MATSIIDTAINRINQFRNHHGFEPTSLEVGYSTYAELRSHPSIGQHLEWTGNGPPRMFGLNVVKLQVPLHLKVV